MGVLLGIIKDGVITLTNLKSRGEMDANAVTLLRYTLVFPIC